MTPMTVKDLRFSNFARLNENCVEKVDNDSGDDRKKYFTKKTLKCDITSITLSINFFILTASPQ